MRASTQSLDGREYMKLPTYFARPLAKIPNPPGPRGEPTWHSIEVGVFRVVDEQESQVGRYVRNYTTLFKTFLQFRRGGQDFALYSPDYTCTRLVQLPGCIDIGGEEPSGMGFCPVEYHVACADDADATGETRLYLECGFVAGCVWGDDSSWKIQFLDLSQATSGRLKRDGRFGYIRLPMKISLAEAISTHTYDPQPNGPSQRIAIAVEREFEVGSGRDMTSK